MIRRLAIADSCEGMAPPVEDAPRADVVQLIVKRMASKSHALAMRATRH
jgi:hypothetical protein